MVAKVPLVCDLDGTLIKADTTYELCLLHLKANPLLGLFDLARWFGEGKAPAKHKLAELHGVQINAEHLPYNQTLIEHSLYTEAPDRVLVSGSADAIVQSVAAHVGGFSLAQGTQSNRNLIAEEKAKFLQERYPDGFDYVGDSAADIPVWKAAREAYGINVRSVVSKLAKDKGISLNVLSEAEASGPALLRAMRLHQWSKNCLLALVPLLNLSHFDPFWIVLLAVAFVAFGCVASATYILNDLLDIPADRAHPTKKERPIAGGRLHVRTSIQAMMALFVAGFVLALLASTAFAAMLLGYVILSLVYSLIAKKIAILDVLLLSTLFCWRIVAGGVLVGVTANSWLLLALGFFFFSLALGKRAIELSKKKASAGQTEHKTATADHLVKGRGYQVRDLNVVVTAGIAASFSSVLVVLIYALLAKSTVIEREISVVLVVVILTFWQTRFWLLVARDQVQDDPIVFALKDFLSVLTLGALGMVVLIEQIWPVGG